MQTASCVFLVNVSNKTQLYMIYIYIYISICNTRTKKLAPARASCFWSTNYFPSISSSWRRSTRNWWWRRRRATARGRRLDGRDGERQSSRKGRGERWTATGFETIMEETTRTSCFFVSVSLPKNTAASEGWPFCSRESEGLRSNWSTLDKEEFEQKTFSPKKHQRPIQKDN